EAKWRGVLSEDQGYGPAHDLATAINTARGPITVAPRLKTRDNHKVTLQLRDAPTKMVFEVLSRETGINFILDKDVKSDTKTTIFVQDVPVEQEVRSEEHTSELQSPCNLVCRLLLEKKNKQRKTLN